MHLPCTGEIARLDHWYSFNNLFYYPPTTLQLNINQEPPAVPAIPDMPGMQHLIQRCLQLQPSARINIDELAEVGVGGWGAVHVSACMHLHPDSCFAHKP